MKSGFSYLARVCFAFWLLSPLAPAAETGELSAARISEIAGWLPEKPAGFGRPIDDRSYWSSPEVVAKANVKEAEKLLTRQ